MDHKNYTDIPGERQLERLAIIRYQISFAQEQAAKPFPINQVALSTMQDFVESALHIICESHKISSGKKSFDQLLEAVVEKLGDEHLRGYVVLMQSMNSARVSFKHHGNSLGEKDIFSHLTESIEFVRKLSNVAYGVNLDSISILAFIKNETAKTHLTEADRELASSTQGALFKLRLAFDVLVKDYIERKTWSPGTSLFDTKPHFMPSKQSYGFQEFEKIVEWIENMDKWVKYISLGIDMRLFAFFDAHTPHIMYSINGTAHADSIAKKVEPDNDIYQKCRSFVIDTALSFMRNDYDFDAWSNRKL
jgi:hypothetical protein